MMIYILINSQFIIIYKITWRHLHTRTYESHFDVSKIKLFLRNKIFVNVSISIALAHRTEIELLLLKYYLQRDN